MNAKATPALLIIAITAVSLHAAPSLENDAMRIDFADAEDGFAPLSISNKLTGSLTRFDGTAFNKRLFSIELRPANELGNWKKEIEITDRAAFASKTTRREGDSLYFDYRNHDIGGERGVFDVTVKITLSPGLAKSRWEIEYENRSTNYVGYSSTFPRFARFLRDGEGDVLLPSANHGAKLLKSHSSKDPQQTPCTSAGYLGYRPMVTAFLKDGGGIYFAAEDPEARIKEICFRDEHYAYFYTPLEVKRPPEGRNGPKYPVALACFKGDWWQAARLYRDWALKQEWTAQGRLIDRKDYPHRLCEIPVWVNAHAYGADHGRAMQRCHDLVPEGVRVGVHWHRWHKPEHCHDYPDYFPARPGVVENVQLFKRINVEGNVYLDSQLWTEGIGDWSNAVKWATSSPGGNFNFEKWCGVRNAVMCPATEFWQKKVQEFSFRCFDELGTDSIYHDQTGAAPARTCYDPAHGHAIGGGTWWYQGYKKMFAPIKARTVKMGGVITTEGTGEVYMSFIDGYLVATQLSDEDVPFYNAVYSGYAYYYGSPQYFDDKLGDSDESYWAVQANEFLWGNAIGWSDDFYFPFATNKIETIQRICRARMQFKDYFAYGQLLDELRPTHDVGSFLIQYTFRCPKPKTYRKKKVVGAIWKNGRTGRIGVCAINLTGEPQTVTFETPDGIAAPAITRIPGETEAKLTVSGESCELALPARGLAFIE